MPTRRSGVKTLGYIGDKVLSARPYSPPPGGSAPDLKSRRCFGNDSCQSSMQTEREVDPPSRIRHQKAFAVSDEIDQYGKNDNAGERGAAPPCGRLYQACAPAFKPFFAGGESGNDEGSPLSRVGQSDGQTQAGLLLAPVGTPCLAVKLQSLLFL